MTTINDVVAFIQREASTEDIADIYTAAKARTRRLRDIQAARVQIGTEVITENLSPKYLNALRGEVVRIDKQRCSVKLDEVSTTILRIASVRRYHIPKDEAQYTLHGIPLGCCKVLAKEEV